MSYDPLLEYNSAERYLYVSFYYPTRESYVPAIYKDVEKTQHITANLPRIVCDFPYLKKNIAKRLNFTHDSIWFIK